MKSVLFVSTGRTGTAAIAANFSRRFPEMRCVHEPFGSRLLRVVGNMYATGHLPEQCARVAVALTHGLRRVLFRKCGLVESNPHMCCLIPVVKTLYPDTIIVHIVRNPVTFVQSYINHGAFHGFKGWLGDHLPFWFIKPKHFRDSTWPQWSKSNPVDSASYRWSILNQIIERDAENWSNEYIRVRYEDLFSESPREWIRICYKCGLDSKRWNHDFTLIRTNASRTTSAPSSAEREYRLNSSIELYRDQATRYGYSM